MSNELKSVVPENLTKIDVLEEGGAEKLQALVEWCEKNNTKVLLYTVWTYWNEGEPTFRGEFEEGDWYDPEEFVEAFPYGHCDPNEGRLYDKPWDGDRGEMAMTIRDNLGDWIGIANTWNAWKAQAMFTDALNERKNYQEYSAIELFEGVTQATLEVSGEGIQIKDIDHLTTDDLDVSCDDDDDSVKDYFRWFCNSYYNDELDLFHDYYDDDEEEDEEDDEDEESC